MGKIVLAWNEHSVAHLMTEDLVSGGVRSNKSGGQVKFGIETPVWISVCWGIDLGSDILIDSKYILEGELQFVNEKIGVDGSSNIDVNDISKDKRSVSCNS